MCDREIKRERERERERERQRERERERERERAMARDNNSNNVGFLQHVCVLDRQGTGKDHMQALGCL
jgi:hypothetical protein